MAEAAPAPVLGTVDVASFVGPRIHLLLMDAELA
jgi:hypothetical protein